MNFRKRIKAGCGVLFFLVLARASHADHKIYSPLRSNGSFHVITTSLLRNDKGFKMSFNFHSGHHPKMQQLQKILLLQKENSNPGKPADPGHAESTYIETGNVTNYMNLETKQITSLSKVFHQQGQTGIEPSKQEKSAPLGFIISFAIVISTLILVLLFAAHVNRLEKKMHGRK
jgi:hypothetical protein